MSAAAPPATGAGAGAPARVWPVGPRAAIVLGAAAVIAWLVLPTAPNYDTATHLVWSRELLDGRTAAVDAAAAPTLHPLWLLAAIVAALTGGGASLLQLVTILSFAVVVACAYRLAADVAEAVAGGTAARIAGGVAAVSIGSSFALLLLAFKAYVDVPFLAAVLAGLVVERAWAPRAAEAGGRAAGPYVMPGLMFVAGLLRPEAWAIGLLLVGLRLVRGGVVRELVGPALVVLAAPVIWALCDLALTGSPMHSLTGTQALAEELGRKTGLANAPRELAVQLSDLARPPIAAAGVVGVGIAVWAAGLRRLLLPLVALVAAGLGFLLVGALGLPLLQRYLQLPAVLLCVFAGIATAIVVEAARGRRVVPWTERRRSAEAGPPAEVGGAGQAGAAAGARATASGSGTSGAPAPAPAIRALAVSALVVGVAGAAGYLVLKADSFRIVGQGVLREADWQRDGALLLEDPRVREAAACGPITLPTYRFVPELTLRAGLDAGAVRSRATALGGAGPQARGVAIVIDGTRPAKTRLGWAAGVPRTTNDVPAGFTEIARRGPFVATARC